jgi:hypothetical protein
MPVLALVRRIAEQVVARKRDPFAVDIQPQATTKLRLTRHPIDLNTVSLPVDRFAIEERPIDRHPVESVAIGGDEGRVVVAARVLDLVDDPVERP